jgi:tRNA (cytidine32/uridine32-2'-O)-methyltransferase
MQIAALVLVETSMAGNLGAALRLAANFGVPRVELVRPRVEPGDDEVLRWARGGESRLEVRVWQRFGSAIADYRTVLGTASGRGREGLPTVDPGEAAGILAARGPGAAALVFGNETSGLARRHLDRCDLVVRIPTADGFPVLNLAQAIAVLVGFLALDATPRTSGEAPRPAAAHSVDGLMEHLKAALADIGFTDPRNPERILRKLRRLLGRAGVTEDEVTILRGICRQTSWAAKRAKS